MQRTLCSCRFQPYPRYASNSTNATTSGTITAICQSQPSMSIKTEAVVSSVSTSGAPLSPLVEPHSNTSTPLVDEPQMTTQRQRNAIGDDGKRFGILYIPLPTVSLKDVCFGMNLYTSLVCSDYSALIMLLSTLVT